MCTPPERRCCIDADGDGHGVGMDCGTLDCDDGASAVHPGAPEVCNGIDDDCDGVVDEPSDEQCDDGADQDCDGLVDCADTDACGDGASCGPRGEVCMGGVCTCAGGAAETACGDSADDDCDGMIDCADPDCGGLACDALGRTCVAGVCECAAGGGPELCNGVDDDCDGSIDRGCPDSIGLCCEAAGPRFGGNDGSDFSISCPGGSAIMGFDGRSSATRYEVAQPICAAVSLAREVAAPEHSYSLRSGTITVVAATSGSGGAPFSDRCTGNEVVIGIEGRSGAEIDQVAFQCGRVTVERDGSNAWRVVVTPTTTSALRGGTGGSPFSYRCPEGRIATGIVGRASDRVKSLALVCSEVTLAAL